VKKFFCLSICISVTVAQSWGRCPAETYLIANFQCGHDQASAFFVLVALKLLADQVLDGVYWSSESLHRELNAWTLLK
jgi:hypothetical protein